MTKTTIDDPELSRKRAEAGRKGAAARWGTPGGKSDGKFATENGTGGKNESLPTVDMPDGAYPDLMSRLKTTRPTAALRQGRNDWYSIENRAGDVAEVFIYDEIGYFGVTASDFVADLKQISAKSIEARINSPGGDVFDGIAIYNALVEHPAQVTVVVDSLAASAAAFVAQAGDKRVMTRNATMMIHEAQGLTIGNAADHQQMLDLLDKMTGNIADILAERTNRSPAHWREAMSAETWYDATEAVDAGLADEVRGRTTESNSFDLSVFNHSSRDEASDPVIPPVTTVTSTTPAPNSTSAGIDFDADAAAKAVKEAFA